VNRLVEKGLIKRRKRGGMWSFEPAISQDEFRAMVSREAVQRALELAPEATITQLVDLLAEREPTVLDELARLVERARAEREEER
jgi:predicted transcriptional regulator